MQSILYIEDEKEIGHWVTGHLEKLGYTVYWLKSGEQALSFVEQVELVILDVMLPGLDGFSVGKRIKKERSDLPIMMLSARSAVEDKLEGLHFADDYLVKPFHPDELTARIDVLLRRYTTNEPETIGLAHLLLYPKENRLVDTKRDQEIRLTGKQYQIFHFLFRNQNRILTKEQIYEGVWGNPFIEGDKTLMVHIRHLREKIEENPAAPTIIETIRGIGYRLQR
ncbi:response regulator transcription factor [Guptibacillus hwajinpoensis]|uniref:response regulator transcription factor n=1 Tax=Guptibacillus hwajinpoensis TaxID=208199 RepID=UPI00384F3193